MTRLLLGPFQLGSAVGTAVRVDVGNAVRRPLLEDHAHHLGNDLSPLLHADQVALPDVQLGNLVGIVQRGILNGRSGHEHLFQPGHRRDSTRPAHLVVNANEARQALLGLELVGQGPSRRLGRGAQRPAVHGLVHLDDHSVNGERQSVASVIPVGQIVHHSRHIVHALKSPVKRQGGLEAPPGGIVDAPGMAVQFPVLQFHPVEETVQSAPGDLLVVVELQAPGRRVARVDKRIATRRHHPLIERFEGGERQDDLPPDFEVGRGLRSERQGNGADGANVVGDVLTRRPVPPGQGPKQATIPVLQGNGHPVILELTGEAALPGRLALDPVRPIIYLLCIVAVGKGQHRPAVGHLLKVLAVEVAAYTFRRAVRIVEFGMGLLQQLQLGQQGIEFTVADGRRRQYIVPVVVLVEGTPEFGDAVSCAHGLGHRHPGRRRRTARSAP